MSDRLGAGDDAEGAVDGDFLRRIGSKIRAVRADRGLTMQQLADGAGISRRLITQIEHGQANPSLVTLTRVARHLGTDFTALLDSGSSAPAPVEVFAAEQRILVWSSARGSTSHLLAATSPARSADLWLWRLVPGDVYHGEADPMGSQELFYVLAGQLDLEVDGAGATVSDGGASRLLSDRPYIYRNAGVTPVTFVRAVSLSPIGTAGAGPSRSTDYSNEGPRS